MSYRRGQRKQARQGVSSEGKAQGRTNGQERGLSKGRRGLGFGVGVEEGRHLEAQKSCVSALMLGANRVSEGWQEVPEDRLVVLKQDLHSLRSGESGGRYQDRSRGRGNFQVSWGRRQLRTWLRASRQWWSVCLNSERPSVFPDGIAVSEPT